MSNLQRLADLEAQAFAKTARIQKLSTTNAELTIQNRQQDELIARFESDFADNSPPQEAAQSLRPPRRQRTYPVTRFESDAANDNPPRDTTPSSQSPRHRPTDPVTSYESDFTNDNPPQQAASFPRPPRRRAPPNTPPIPFYVTARTAPTLQLSFVVAGFKGETLECKAEMMDLAFILQRTLQRRGLGEQMTRKGVCDFLEVPLIKVEWTGKLGDIGKLV